MRQRPSNGCCFWRILLKKFSLVNEGNFQRRWRVPRATRGTTSSPAETITDLRIRPTEACRGGDNQKPTFARFSEPLDFDVFNSIGAKRTFAEKLCQLGANRQHHSISSLDGPREAIWHVSCNRFGTSSTRNGTCSNLYCQAYGPLGPKRRFERRFDQKEAWVSRRQVGNTRRAAPCVFGLDRF
jgi:hypothetical protein